MLPQLALRFLFTETRFTQLLNITAHKNKEGKQKKETISRNCLVDGSYVFLCKWFGGSLGFTVKSV